MHIFKTPNNEFSVFNRSKYEYWPRDSRNKSRVEPSNKWSSDEEDKKTHREAKWEKESVYNKSQNIKDTSSGENNQIHKRKHTKRKLKSPSPVQNKREKKRNSHHRHSK
jgi:hypothetical protein